MLGQQVAGRIAWPWSGRPTTGSDSGQVAVVQTRPRIGIRNVKPSPAPELSPLFRAM